MGPFMEAVDNTLSIGGGSDELIGHGNAAHAAVSGEQKAVIR